MEEGHAAQRIKAQTTCRIAWVDIVPVISRWPFCRRCSNNVQGLTVVGQRLSNATRTTDTILSERGAAGIGGLLIIAGAWGILAVAAFRLNVHIDNDRLGQFKPALG